MNLRAVEGTPLVRAQPMGQSLCEIWIRYVSPPTTNVTTYPLLSCGTNITRYVWGLDISGQSGGRASSQAEMQGAGGVGGLCAVFPDNGITPYYPCYDANGNVTEYVDFIGNTVAHYAYDAFGNTVNTSGSMADDFKHRFSTKYLDVETGLYYYGNIRYYSPPLGRWISRDPIEEEGGLNLYGFCGNDPINKWDYLGMASSKQCNTCGPDVTAEVDRILSNISSTFGGWWGWQKYNAWKSLHKNREWGWDIIPLQQWGKDGKTVQFKGKCYHASSVNYAMWGRVNRLCYLRFGIGGMLDPSIALFSPLGALGLSSTRKAVKFGGAQMGESNGFTIYGYFGIWLDMPEVTGNPPQEPYPPFDWRWLPLKNPDNKKTDRELR